MRRKVLTDKEARLILRLAPLVIPTNGPKVHHVSAKMVQRVDRFLFELPALLRFLFRAGMWIFDFFAILFVAPHRRFRELKPPRQELYLRRLSRTWFRPLYEWWQLCRGLILMFYYSQPEVAAVLNYHPEEWARKKILQRRRELNLIEPQASDQNLPKSPAESRREL